MPKNPGDGRTQLVKDWSGRGYPPCPLCGSPLVSPVFILPNDKLTRIRPKPIQVSGGSKNKKDYAERPYLEVVLKNMCDICWREASAPSEHPDYSPPYRFD